MKSIIDLIKDNPSFAPRAKKGARLPQRAFGPKDIEENDAFGAFLDNEPFDWLGASTASGHAFFGSKECLAKQEHMLSGYIAGLREAEPGDLPFVLAWEGEDFGCAVIYDDYERDAKMPVETGALKVPFGPLAGNAGLQAALEACSEGGWMVGKQAFCGANPEHAQLLSRAREFLRSPAMGRG